MNIHKAKLLDKILSKFTGNVTIKWSDLKEGIWDDIASYHVCENNINFLVGDQLLKRDNELQTLYLTDKGFATMTDLENLGYRKQAYKERRDNFFKYLSYFVGICTFIILCLNTFVWNGNKQTSSVTTTTADSTNNSIKVKTVDNSGQTDYNNQPLQDKLLKK